MLKWMAGALVALASIPAYAAVQEEPVTYKDGDTSFSGYIVYDDAQKVRRPGVLIVHEWWGITKHTRDSARDLAAKGYTAFVVDMFGNGKTADEPKTAAQLSGEVRKNPAMQLSRFNAARAQLLKHSSVDPKRVSAIGYCFGGSVVLDMARAGVDLAGVAAFHAGLTTQQPAAPGKVRAKILVLNGAADPFIKPDTVEAFKKEMETARVDYRYVNYPGAVHAFTNPEATEKGQKFKLPLAYDPQADKQSRAEMEKFFATLFGGK